MYDIVIRDGSIVDGSGREAFIGDLAIKGGYIVAVGKFDGDGLQEIAANGATVSPGFIDLHTHLDAQAGWDPDMTPSSWHGVTTALIGNCGMTFAPCKPEDREHLAGMMETVEDIPKEAVLNSLAWDWEGYGEFLNSIEKIGTRINLAGLVGHAAVRVYVMGVNAYDGLATEGELEQINAIVGKSIDDGAFGFSVNRYEPHRGPDGRSIPGTFAPLEELQAIAGVVASRKAFIQIVGAGNDMIAAIADVNDCRMLIGYGSTAQPGAGEQAALALDELCTGRNVTAVAHARGSGFMFGLQARLPFHGDTWDKVAALDLAGRLTALADPIMSAKLVDEAKQESVTGLDLDGVFYLGNGENPDYTNSISLLAESKAAGEHWSETFIRHSLDSAGKGLFNYPMFAHSFEQLAAIFKSDNMLPGIGDAGAHISQVMDAGWPSFMFSYWYRTRGFYSLPQLIRHLTARPAAVIGLSDRGLLAPGKRADINIFDETMVAELQPEYVNDLPQGAPRFIQQSVGFKATIVNGRISFLDGQLVGERAGLVLRHPRAVA